MRKLISNPSKIYIPLFLLSWINSWFNSSSHIGKGPIVVSPQ
jgi:hypothetical protein